MQLSDLTPEQLQILIRMLGQGGGQPTFGQGGQPTVGAGGQPGFGPGSPSVTYGQGQPRNPLLGPQPGGPQQLGGAPQSMLMRYLLGSGMSPEQLMQLLGGNAQQINLQPPAGGGY